MMTAGKRLTRFALSGSVALVLATPTTEARAQSATENADGPDAPGSMPLSAAIVGMRPSPFYTSDPFYTFDPLAPLASSMSSHLWAPFTVGSPGSAIRPTPNDSTFSTRRVFLMSFGAAALSDVLALGFALCGAYGGSGCLDSDAIHVIGAIATPVFGTAAGAKLAGAPFLPALAGSALGSGLALGALVVFDPDGNSLWFFGIPAAIQAGMTTLIVSAVRSRREG